MCFRLRSLRQVNLYVLFRGVILGILVLGGGGIDKLSLSDERARKCFKNFSFDSVQF